MVGDEPVVLHYQPPQPFSLKAWMRRHHQRILRISALLSVLTVFVVNPIWWNVSHVDSWRTFTGTKLIHFGLGKWRIGSFELSDRFTHANLVDELSEPTSTTVPRDVVYVRSVVLGWRPLGRANDYIKCVSGLRPPRTPFRSSACGLAGVQSRATTLDRIQRTLLLRELLEKLYAYEGEFDPDIKRQAQAIADGIVADFK